jgi:hypothetical protein
MEPWTYDHIHEKPEERHRLARLIVGVALLWGCVLVAVVETGGITKRAIKRVKRRDTGYNRNTRREKCRLKNS